MRNIISTVFLFSFFAFTSEAFAVTYGSDLYGTSLYSANQPDSSVPVRSAGSPSGELSVGTTSTSLSLTTDESATCKYGTAANAVYGSIASTFTTTGSTSHSATISGLEDGESYTYYVRCSDSSSNVNTDDYSISFSVDEGGSVTGSAPYAGMYYNTPQNSGPVAFKFNFDLYYGYRNEDVRQMQKYLNTHGSPVAPYGLGSLGFETNYFGPATKAALREFQRANGITPTGNLGPLTRALMNSQANITLPSTSTKTAVVLSINLNVRAVPGGAILGTVSQGSTGTVISTLGNWYKVRFTNGLEGYVYGTLIRLQ